MTRFAIRFDFVDGGELWAGLTPGNPPSFGFAPTLASAELYDDRATAERVLRNAYGEGSRVVGVVVEVAAEVKP